MTVQILAFYKSLQADNTEKSRHQQEEEEVLYWTLSAK